MQNGVRVRPGGQVQRRYCSMSYLRTKGKLYLLPQRNTSLPQWGMLVFTNLILIVSGMSSLKPVCFLFEPFEQKTKDKPFCLLVWKRYALVPFVKNMVWRYAPVPAEKARMRQLNCATCAA